MEFQLSEDHLTTQKWVHEFAEREIRPVAPEYDEREEFPWPVLKKAAEIGLYGLEFYMETLAADPTGLMFPICLEETCWGCAGISLGIWGTGLPLSTLAYTGTSEQLMQWAPLMFGTPEDPKVAKWGELLKKDFPDDRFSIYTLFGIASAQVVVEALKRTGKDLTPQSLKATMEKMCGRFSDVYAGNICWSPEDHQGNKIGAWIRMEKGKAVNIGAKWVPPGK